MGKLQFSRNSGMKRRHEHKRSLNTKKKNRRYGVEEKRNTRSPSPSTSDEENSDVALDEQVEEESVMDYKEPTMYDTLLDSLRTKREEYGTDDEEIGDDAVHGASGSDSEGSDSETSRLNESGASPLGGGLGNPVEGTGGTETDNSEASDSDEEQESRVNGEPTGSTSSFRSHLDHKLSKEEVDRIQEKKWTYKWMVSLSNCKWRGTGECFLKELESCLKYGLKPTLYKHWLGIYKKSGGLEFDSSNQKLFFSICNSYRDILHHNKKPFYLKGLEEDSSTMDAYIMHSLNHIFRTRDLVKKNEAKLAKLQESVKAEILNNEAFLDRGFTRPKILMLLPLASVAFRVVKRLIDLTPPKYKSNVEERERFYREFGSEVSEDNEDVDAVENYESERSSKPSDFQALFGGNNNDHFMVGIKFTRRSIRLYGDFYSSDMIVASPLGLITKIGEAEVDKNKNVDYLSSIEILIVDHADVILMQNWSHVNTIVEQLNRIPSEQHGTDIMRIRQWYLDSQAPFYRQSIILSSHVNPDINGLFNHHCLNHEGKVKSATEYKGVLPKVLLQVRQIYQRFDAKTIQDADDARFDYFTKKVFPKIKDSVQGGIMLFISSYFEFIRVRNFLRSQEASICLLGEYTEQSDISRTRVSFFNGKKKIMLYTERAHFYHRYKIRGIQNLIIYSLPERKEFYPEVVNMLQGSDCTVLFSRFDQLRLERIVGTTAAKRMTTSDKGIFVFC